MLELEEAIDVGLNGQELEEQRRKATEFKQVETRQFTMPGLPKPVYRNDFQMMFPHISLTQPNGSPTASKP